MRQLILSVSVVGLLLLALPAYANIKECENLSHQKLLKELNTMVYYQQIDCTKFVKYFVDNSSQELITKEEVVFSREWKKTVVDNIYQYYEKKYRVYWSIDHKTLIEDYMIDGYLRISGTPKVFTRFKMATFKKKEDHILKQGYNTHRYEYPDGEIENQSKPFEERLDFLDPETFEHVIN